MTLWDLELITCRKFITIKKVVKLYSNLKYQDSQANKKKKLKTNTKWKRDLSSY